MKSLDVMIDKKRGVIMSNKTPTKRQLQGEKTKKRLIETAMKLFLEKGYNNVSVDEIIAATSSSKGSFYTHFKSKINLLDDVLLNLDKEYNAYYNNELFNSELDSLSKIGDFIIMSQQLIFNLLPFDILKSIVLNDQQKNVVFNLKMNKDREYYKILEHIINEGKNNHEIKDIDTYKIISWIVGIQRGCIYNYCIEEAIDNHISYMGEMIDLVIHKIKS